jgi:tetratricopeptide (TPR) repeat protein
VGKPEENSMTVEKLLEKGDDLIKRKKYEKALKAYENAIKINPDFAEAWKGKGVALLKRKRYYDALLAFDNAININKTFAKA